MNRILFAQLLIVLLCFQVGVAQNDSISKPETINEKFEKLLKESNNYEDYKVIKKHKIYQLRENTQKLFGFATDEEHDLFVLLIERVSGIGPSIALAILSGMPVEEFKQHVVGGNVTELSRIKGLGKKTAERIVLELKDKVGVVESWEGAEGPASAVRDAELALISLGYKQAEAKKSLAVVSKANPDATVDELIREALRGLA